MGRIMAVAGAAVAGVTAVLAGGVVPAAAATVTQVPCSTPALVSAISGAASGATLSLARGCIYVLTAALPTVAQDLTIDGYGDTLERSTASGTAAFTILTITAGTVTLDRLSFNNGNGAIAVDNQAQLNVTGGVFSYNTAAYGAAINNTDDSVVQATGASFIDNTATEDGGAFYVYAALGDKITNCKFLGNTTAGAGGAYWEWSNGTTIAGSTFRGNTAGLGGALFFDDQGSGITGTVIQGNSATGGGGGIAETPGGAPVGITNSKITGNYTAGEGGGIYEGSTGIQSISNTIIANNSAADGGGIYDDEYVYTEYTDDTISGNHASGDAGGISLSGLGALFTGTTISSNHAGGDGGGIDNSAAPISGEPPAVSLADSTISGNHSGGHGGGLYNTGSLDASSTQITGNQAIGGGGGIYDDGADASATLTDSSPTGNKPDNCEPLGSITGCTD